MLLKCLLNTYKKFEENIKEREKDEARCPQTTKHQTETIKKTIKERKLKYCGHIRRHKTIQKKILEGKIMERGTRQAMTAYSMTVMKRNECCEAALDGQR